MSSPAGAVIGAPRALLQLEGAAIAAAAVWAYFLTGAGWGLFALLILAPDLSMLGYLAGRRAGAIAYNAGHTLLAPGALALVGGAAGWTLAWPLAAIWIAHIGIDRALGYGLKYRGGFGRTHLGVKASAARPAPHS